VFVPRILFDVLESLVPKRVLNNMRQSLAECYGTLGLISPGKEAGTQLAHVVILIHLQHDHFDLCFKAGGCDGGKVILLVDLRHKLVLLLGVDSFFMVRPFVYFANFCAKLLTVFYHAIDALLLHPLLKRVEQEVSIVLPPASVNIFAGPFLLFELVDDQFPAVKETVTALVISLGIVISHTFACLTLERGGHLAVCLSQVLVLSFVLLGHLKLIIEFFRVTSSILD
jgi:hypothetical protein